MEKSGANGKAAMETINLDSEDEKESQSLSMITIDDDNQSLNHMPEKSELSSEEVGASNDQTKLFEITFQSKEVFQKLANDIISSLREILDTNDDEKVTLRITSVSDDDFRIEAHSLQRTKISFSSLGNIAAKDYEYVQSGDEESKLLTADDNIEQTVIIEEGEVEDGDETFSSAVAAPTSPVDQTEPDLSGVNELFKIDTQPAENVDIISIPSYKRTIKDVLAESSSKKKKKSEDCCSRPKKTSNCFNCNSSGHGLRDCPRPRNMKKINQAKKSVMHYKQERYHVDVEQRFAHLRPGIISEKLKAALGLRKGELPFFFYRMRVLGYPPGWLEDAKVTHSGISLFNSEGLQVLESDDEEGQVDVNKHKYDVKKLISFPGFNVDPGPKFFDDYKHFQVPPLNPLDKKEELIKMLGNNVIKGYKRKKLKELPTVSAEGSDGPFINDILQQSDMEIEDEHSTEHMPTVVIFTRPMPPSEPPKIDKPPPPPMSPKTVEHENKSTMEHTNNPSIPTKREPSPSLEDLEAQQQKLLIELQSNISTNNIPDDSLIDEIIALDVTTTDDDEQNDAELQVSISDADKPALNENSQETTEAYSVSETSSPKTPSLSISATKESHLGTPLLKFSPFDKLPCGDHFKVGVSDVINFENLPGASGKYEQMKVVIKKVRNVITKLYSEDN